MKTSMPPRLPTNKPSIRRMRLHAGLATSLDPTSARIPYEDSHDDARETSQSGQVGAEIRQASNVNSLQYSPIKRTMPPIRTKSRASVSNGTCDAIFPTVETMEIGIFSSRV